MSPQVSNRDALLEGALRCIEERGYAEITTRDIARVAGANVASISYHFGSKDALIAAALAEGFRRWLAELAVVAARAPQGDSKAQARLALETLEQRLEDQRGLARAFVSALSHAVHHEDLRKVLADAFEEMRTGLVALLRLDADGFGRLQASLVIAAFNGLLIQWLIDPGQAKESLRQLPAFLDAVPDEVFE